jgi:hypothetical protein
MDRDLGFLVDILIAARDLEEFKQGTTVRLREESPGAFSFGSTSQREEKDRGSRHGNQLPKATNNLLSSLPCAPFTVPT